MYFYVFFFNATTITVIYTLSLHDALPIYIKNRTNIAHRVDSYFSTYPNTGYGTLDKKPGHNCCCRCCYNGDRKSTRLNSSHVAISYAVFCLKKKKKKRACSTK